jgi:hypothetical protein
VPIIMDVPNFRSLRASAREDTQRRRAPLPPNLTQAFTIDSENVENKNRDQLEFLKSESGRRGATI